MINEIKVKNIQIFQNKVIYDYDISGDWEIYFINATKMEICYSEDVTNVPKSVHMVPFLSNILPIVWLCDAVLYVDEIDKDFFDNLELVKKGYREMYPMFEFKGKIVAANVEKNVVKEQNKTAAFFSGGVDAYTTLFRHIEENPFLVTIWGADIKLNDVEGWKNVENHICNVSQEYGLEYFVIKTNFRSVINEAKLDQLVKASKDGWWHGFQHGIALIGNIAPLAYIKQIGYTYIASSYPEKMKGRYTCASDPTIDNYVKYCGCETIHDAYELDRQEKIRFLVKQKEEQNRTLHLRVCWISTGGKNCCRCEKCYRTILEIVSEGGDPNEYGFIWDKQHIKSCKKAMLNNITLEEFAIEQYYYPIQPRMIENRTKIINYEEYKWLLDIDFSKYNNYPMKVFKRTFIWKVLRKLFRRG